MKLPPFRFTGDEHAKVILEGDPKKRPEPTYVSIGFPGGEVTVSRCDDGSYWVHVGTEKVFETNQQIGRISDARLDIEGRNASEVNVGEFSDPKLCHLAVRVARLEPETKKTPALAEA